MKSQNEFTQLFFLDLKNKVPYSPELIVIVQKVYQILNIA